MYVYCSWTWENVKLLNTRPVFSQDLWWFTTRFTSVEHFFLENFSFYFFTFPFLLKRIIFTAYTRIKQNPLIFMFIYICIFYLFQMNWSKKTVPTTKTAIHSKDWEKSNDNHKPTSVKFGKKLEKCKNRKIIKKQDYQFYCRSEWK